MLLVLLLGSFFGAEVERLGCEDYFQRESAQTRLRSYGWFALPAIAKGQQSESAEVRIRCNELLRGWAGFCWKVKAADVLASRKLIHPMRFWSDEHLRLCVYRVAMANGCIYFRDDPAISEQSPWQAWFMLLSFRYQLGTNGLNEMEELSKLFDN